MSLPREAVSPGATRVYLAMVELDRRDPSMTVRAVMAESRYRSTGSLHVLLSELRAAGLVSWEPGKSGTLHLVARPVRSVA